MKIENTKYQKTIEMLEISIKKKKRVNKILFILLISFILGIIGTFIIVSLNYLTLIVN
nr:MAG TPA_asm: hemolysin XhlA [Caudoviricetes sp.]